MRGSEVEGKTILAETWLMEVERRMRFQVIENSMTRNAISASTLPGHLSMQLHTFMLGIDVARRVLLGIFTLPFRTGGAGKHAPKIITSILYGVMIPYGKCLVNYAQVYSHGLSRKKQKFGVAIWTILCTQQKNQEKKTPLHWINGDGWRVIMARALRSFGYGFTSVLLGVTLNAAGFSTVQIGFLLTVALVGDMLAIILVALFADRLGRRRVLVFFALMMSVTGLAFAFSHNLIVLLLAAFLAQSARQVRKMHHFLLLSRRYCHKRVQQNAVPIRSYAIIWSHNSLAQWAD